MPGVFPVELGHQRLVRVPYQQDRRVKHLDLRLAAFVCFHTDGPSTPPVVFFSLKTCFERQFCWLSHLIMYLCLFSPYITPCSGAKPLEGASPSFPRRRPRRCVARGLGAGSWALPFPGGLGQHLAAKRLFFTGPAPDLAKCRAPSGHCPPRTISNIYRFNP